MKVLSLFDGISCGMVALERAGIPVERYVAYEIDESAIAVSVSNYPKIEQCGDVFKADFSQYKSFDLLIGGSPCTYWSIAQNKDRETTSEGFGWELFKQYLKAKEESGCRYFLYENNKSMSDAIKNEITKHLGVEPIMINSALVSAQNRERYYWTNIPGVEQPANKHICLNDVLSDDDFKPYRGGALIRKKDDLVEKSDKMHMIGATNQQCSIGCRVYDMLGKAKTLCANAGGGGAKTGLYMHKGQIKSLSVSGAEKMQTLPVGYTRAAKPENGITHCGNGWTVDVIAHIFTYMKKQEREEKEMELKVNTPTFPEVIEFNFEELKTEITERASAYANLVYTEDQIQDAKKDRASLNKFVKALSDERIKVKKECMKPYEDFEAKIKELDGIVSKAIKNIDDQLKSYEEHEKAEKLEKIKELWESIEHPAEMQFEHVFKDKFLNKSCSIGTITQYFKDDVDRFKRDMVTLQNLPEFSFEAVEVYKQTLDMHKAISEGKRLAEIQKRKEEAERQKAEAEAKMEESMHKLAEAAKQTGTAIVEAANKISEEVTTSSLKMWVSFKALMTTEEAFALKDFFNSRGIEFRSI